MDEVVSSVGDTVGTVVDTDGPDETVKEKDLFPV